MQRTSTALRHRGIQIDLGRVIERPEVVEALLPLYAEHGYNTLQLYLENAFRFPSHPQLARHRAWTFDQAMRVTETAGQVGIRVIPAIQSLGHAHWVTEHPEYAALDETCESGKQSGVLCPAHPRTLEMLEGMIRDVAPLATAGIIHLGMDEAFAIGCCPRCAPLRAASGEGAIFVAHANRVAALAKAVGKRPAIWGDLFYYYPEELAQLDKNMLIFDWYYYAFPHVPRIELYGFPDIDTRALWAQHGLDAWGCPASVYTAMMPVNLPAESLANARSWGRYLRATGGEGIMCTQWELAPASLYYALPFEVAAAKIFLDAEAPEIETLLATACAELYDRPALAACLEEMGRYRFHGHCTRRWLHAAALPQMITYLPIEDDLARAARMEALAGEIAGQAAGARRAEMVAAFVPAARWLAYQYRKRAEITLAACDAVAGRYAEARARLLPLCDEALALADAWQQLWDATRYPDDPARLPAQLQKDAALFSAEADALDAALAGAAYAGTLTTPILNVHVINSHPAIPALAVAISADASAFTDLGKGLILEFSSHAAQPTSDDALTYAFPVPALDAARFVRITAVGDGQFTLRNITLHQGEAQYGVQQAIATGRVGDPRALTTGAGVLMGYDDLRGLHLRLMAEGNSGRIFTEEHGALIAEMAVPVLTAAEKG